MSFSHSIIIPTKDRPGLLRRAVLSALSELAPSGELIVVDDHSLTAASTILHDLQNDNLRIITLATGRTGVSEARNAGVRAARGDVIFFLDDDDTLMPGYCQRILSRATADHDYGFSSYLQVADADKPAATPGSIRFAQGTIPASAPLRKKLCGFGMGFWILRQVALETGEIATDLSINEDTDYVCRLITAARRGWYSDLPGVRLHRHIGRNANLGHLTHRTSASERARCMRVVCERYPDMVLHLGAGYIRHCLKTETPIDAWRFIREQTDWRIRNRLRLFALFKTLAYRMAPGGRAP